MNSLILSLAPFSGLATALPAMTAAETAAPQSPDDLGEARFFAAHENSEVEAPAHDRNGGYLLL